VYEVFGGIGVVLLMFEICEVDDFDGGLFYLVFMGDYIGFFCWED